MLAINLLGVLNIAERGESVQSLEDLKVKNFHVAIDLSEEWAKLDNGCEIVIGVLVMQKAFA